MSFITNFSSLATTENRKKVLTLIEEAFASIQPDKVMEKEFFLEGNRLNIQGKTFDLNNFDRVRLIGFGKGSAGISKIIETKLGDKLSDGYVIDTNEEQFSNIHFTLGTHPLPSEQNMKFTGEVLQRFSNLNERDLVLVVICGGGSAMLVHPDKLTLEDQININKALLASGGDIYQMNTVRKHFSLVKGGGLAKVLYPATVVSLIFSDVPGNDLSFIASGPTVKDTTTNNDAWNLIEKYGIQEKLNITKDMLTETPKDDKYFTNTTNILVLSNLTALNAMKKKAEDLGLNATIFSDKFQSEARLAGKKLIDATRPGEVLLAGGETTVTVHGSGKGGRNQEVVLATLFEIPKGVVIASFDSDGWDNTSHAGAIGDQKTVEKTKVLNLSIQDFLTQNSSFDFFDKTGDAISTGRLPSNVSDLFIVLKS